MHAGRVDGQDHRPAAPGTDGRRRVPVRGQVDVGTPTGQQARRVDPGRNSSTRPPVSNNLRDVVVTGCEDGDNIPELVSSCLGWWVGLDMVVCGVWPLVGRW